MNAVDLVCQMMASPVIEELPSPFEINFFYPRLCGLSLTAEQKPDADQWLTGDEKMRANRFSNHWQRISYVNTHAALNQQLSLLTRSGSQTPAIALAEHGKPFLPHYQHLHYNLSDTHGFALAAFWDQPVGVDVELIRPIDQIQLIADRYFSVSDRLFIEDDSERFLLLWTRKEAVLKLTGIGLTDYLNQFSVSRLRWRGPRHWLGLFDSLKNRVWVYSFISDGMVISVATFKRVIAWETFDDELYQ